jgi:antitoxin Phd
MLKQYSIAEARHNLASIVHGLERTPLVELTRRGKPIAVLLSLREFFKLKTNDTNFWKSYSDFRSRHDLAALNIKPECWSGVRDQTPGREVNL